MAIATAPPMLLAVGTKHERRWRTQASKSIAVRTTWPCSTIVLLHCCAVSFQLNKILRDSRVRWSVYSQRRAPVSEALTRAYQTNHRSLSCVKARASAGQSLAGSPHGILRRSSPAGRHSLPA
jgi:hypothetical protein